MQILKMDDKLSHNRPHLVFPLCDIVMFGYRLCLETLNVPFKNIKGCGCQCTNVFVFSFSTVEF